ncbi:hypothetical protein PXO_01606 [Xanthomonas oryzae pv. oryzae PXO99A]|uniref:Uncharacterized protein n=1 Tax=Xanthomonas oryzae pv. oryzae (strain PXO99A) TaxID=360094 RepID=A0A0K0GM80_XANOP|nr:hypothetical protein PXO_01606 [Xanthomonas oryzae pv. oryzae PXO99A]
MTHRIAKRAHCSPLTTTDLPLAQQPVTFCIDVTLLGAIC